MAYTYDISTSKKDSRANACLFSCHTMGQIISLFVSTFLVAYIYDYCATTLDYILNVAIYNVATYAFFGILYPIIAKIVDKTNRVWVYRLGLVLRATLVIVSIYCGRDISKMLILAGFINGVSDACYYASYNVLKQEMVSRNSMSNFVMVMQVVGKIVNIVVPIVMGALIEVSTFAMVSIYVLVICVVQIGLSFGIKSQKPDGSSFSIKNFFAKLKQNEDVYKKVKFTYIMHFVYGFTSIVSVLINICIMIEFGSSFSLGILTSIFSVLSIIVILLFTKFTKSGKRGWAFIVFGVFPVVATVVFAIIPNMVTLIIQSVVIAICGIVNVSLVDLYRNSTLKEAGLYNEICEHQTIIEFCINTSRTLSYVLLLVLGLINNLTVFYVFLVIFVLSYLGVYIMLYFYEKKYAKPTKTLEQQQKNDIIDTQPNS